MPSLTAFLPEIAPYVGLTNAALYERQRALVRLGLLPKPQGRGRGSGAEATPRNVALLLISVLMTDNLSDTNMNIKALATAPVRKRSLPMKKGKNFLEALTIVLGDEKLAAEVASVQVDRYLAEGTIFWKRPLGESHFFEDRVELSEHALVVQAALRGHAILALASKLAKTGAKR